MNMNKTTDIVKQFFGVVTRGETYLNIIYLLLAFPLGTAYFVFLVTGLSLGLSLLIIWVGIPILLFMIVAWWGLVVFERQLAIWLLHVDIPPDITRKYIRTERMGAAQSSPEQPFDLERPGIPFCKVPTRHSFICRGYPPDHPDWSIGVCALHLYQSGVSNICILLADRYPQ